jgi:hypothetical protein
LTTIIFFYIVNILINTTSCTICNEVGMVTRKTSKNYKTNDICTKFDISRATLFRWESEGLLTGVERDWRGWRVYNDDNLKDIERIMKSKNAG